MHLKAKLPVLVPPECREEIEKLSKAALIMRELRARIESAYAEEDAA